MSFKLQTNQNPEEQNRLENLRALIRLSGATELCSMLEYTNGFLSQLAGPNPIRKVTEKQARKIEEKLNLKRKSLDDASFYVNYSKTVNSVKEAKSGSFSTSVLDEVNFNVHATIDRVRLTNCIEKILLKKFPASSAQLAAMITLLYCSGENGDTLDAIENLLSEIVVSPEMNANV